MATIPKLAAALGLLTALALAAPVGAQSADVVVHDIGVNGGDRNDIRYHGQSAGIAAYSIATQSCNKGTAELDWFSGSTLHPVIAQNMFRLKDGRFEQLGYSWLKHGFCAVNETEGACGPCNKTPCSTLGIGCADTYSSWLNDGSGGESKTNVNAATGAHTHGGGPSGPGAIRGRLQVEVAEIAPPQNAGALYFIEGQYVTQDDAAAGNSTNNVSWRRVKVHSVSNVDGDGSTRREQPAIFAWRDEDPLVEVIEVKNVEGAMPMTSFFLGFRVTRVETGLWRYEYALQNLNSDQGAGAFSVPVGAAVSIGDIGFHDVNPHSGDTYDGTDWPGARVGGEVRWATTPHGTNASANALRWGTLYNFRFEAAAPPIRGPVNIGLFKPALSTDINVPDILVPGDPLSAPVAGGNLAQGSSPQPVPPVTVTPPIPRNGGGLNPLALHELAPALVGHTWKAKIDLAGARCSLLFVGSGGPTEGTFRRMGEMLVLPPLVHGQVNDMTVAIPDDARLVGTVFSVQAAVHTAQGWRLTNALDVTVGGSCATPVAPPN